MKIISKLFFSNLIILIGMSSFSLAGWQKMNYNLPTKNNHSHGDGIKYLEKDSNDNLYVGISNLELNGKWYDGIYILKGNEWEKIAERPNKYGVNQMNIIDGKLFSRNYYLKLDDLETGWHRVDLPKKISNIDKNIMLDVEGKSECSLFMVEGTKNPNIIEYNVCDNKWKDLDFPFDNLDGKPHINIVYVDGRIWYKSNYSGIFLYENDNWSKIDTKSGKLGYGGDGKLFLSREEIKYTQVATTYLYDDGQWKGISENKGYGYDCKPFQDKGAYCIDGRFGGFVYLDGETYNLPKYTSRTGDTDVRVIDSVAIGNIIYILRKDKNGKFIQKIDYNIDDYAKLITDLDLKLGTYLAVGKGAKSIGLKSLGDKIFVGFYGKLSNTEEKAYYLKVFLKKSNSLKLQKTIKLNSELKDMEVDRVGNKVLLATKNKSLSINSNNYKVLNEYVGSDKIDSDDDKVVLLDSKSIIVYDGQEKIWSKTIDRSYIKDIAISSKAGKVYVVGFDNKSLPSGNPVQVAFLEAYNLDDGNYSWKRFGFDGSKLTNNIADTRLYNVNIGKDGKLYILGESAGSQTIFRYNGLEYKGNTFVTFIDFFTQLRNTASAHIAYYARLDPVSGNMEKSQLSMSRLISESGKGKSNTYRVSNGGLASNENGDVAIAGTNTYRIPNRNFLKINGSSVSNYAGSDPSIQVLTSSFNSRYLWHTFGKDSDTKGSMNDVAFIDDNIVGLGVIKQGDGFITDSNSDFVGDRIYLNIFSYKDSGKSINYKKNNKKVISISEIIDSNKKELVNEENNGNTIENKSNYEDNSKTNSGNNSQTKSKKNTKDKKTITQTQGNKFSHKSDNKKSLNIENSSKEKKERDINTTDISNSIKESNNNSNNNGQESNSRLKKDNNNINEENKKENKIEHKISKDHEDKIKNYNLTKSEKKEMKKLADRIQRIIRKYDINKQEKITLNVLDILNKHKNSSNLSYKVKARLEHLQSLIVLNNIFNY